MTRLAWGSTGERRFEAGVDRGVLYVEGIDGVAWNGLVSVSESPSDEELKTFYIDGFKYLNHAYGEEFAATIQAFTYPDEFGPCEGINELSNGLFASQQKKKTFGLSYRTLIGNDVDGIDHAYKVHLVYNALAAPTTRDNTTLSSNVEPSNFSWQITTKPPRLDGYKPVAHFIIDSRHTDPTLLTAIEDVLYGSEISEPRLPDVNELLFIFDAAASADAGSSVEPYDLILDGGSA